MKKASKLHNALLDFVGQCDWADQRHAYVLVWMVIGVIQEGNVNLTRWLSHVQTSAQQAQSTQTKQPTRFWKMGSVSSSLTYRQLDEKARAIAAYLQAQLTIGDRVLLVVAKKHELDPLKRQ